MKPKTYWEQETLPEWAVPDARVVVRHAARDSEWTRFAVILRLRVHNGAHVADLRFDNGVTDTYDFFWIRPLSLIEAIGDLAEEA